MLHRSGYEILTLKQVTVLVNGNPIPFNMKIGEAGEAFFVFETDDDVPEDLITSPLLQPEDSAPSDTKPDDKPEPDFLDLDGSSERKRQPSDATPPQTGEENPTEREQNERVDEALRRYKIGGDSTPNVEFTDSEWHHFLYTMKSLIIESEMVYDMEGYHATPAHDRERSDRTVTSHEDFRFPGS